MASLVKNDVLSHQKRQDIEVRAILNPGRGGRVLPLQKGGGTESLSDAEGGGGGAHKVSVPMKLGGV